jgi:hypothetical protein
VSSNGEKETNKHPVTNISCPTKPNKLTPDMSKTIEQLAETMTKKVCELADAWKAGSDPYALFKANFTVDFYCSHLLAICNPVFSKYYEPDESGLLVQGSPTLKQFWASSRSHSNTAHDSHIVWKEGALEKSYEEALKTSLDAFEVIRNDTIKNVFGEKKISSVKVLLSKIFRKSDKPNISKNKKTWFKMTPQQIVTGVESALTKSTKYYRGGWGMFQLAHMVNFMEHTRVKECPCSCICRSLLFLSVLATCGYPAKDLWITMQSFSETNTRGTHWAARCENPRTMIYGDYNLIKKNSAKTTYYRANTAKAMQKFTSNVLFYYIVAINSTRNILDINQKIRGEINKQSDAIKVYLTKLDNTKS